MSLFRNASLLTIGQLGTHGCSLARNMILARVLSKADFGLVSIFAMTITLLELTSRMSLGTQIVQSSDGDREDFQQTFHSVLAGVGLISALAMVALAIPFASMFKVPQVAWAFALLAMVPLLKGFEHLDNYRQRRHFNFLPGVLCELIPQVIVTLAVWPLALWLGDFRVILWVIIGKAGLTILLTHTFAIRSYRWSLNKEFIGDMISFSWPLFLNGFLIFLSQQADQLLIGSFLNLEDVALYAAAFSFAILPFFILAPVLANLFLPTLSRLQENPQKFLRSYTTCLQTSALVAAFTLSPIISSGEYIASIIYGAKYQNTGSIVAILGASCALRCFRIAPSIAAIAKADTINQLYSNLVRCTSILLVLAAVLIHSSLELIASCTLAAEIAACFYSFYRLRKIQGVPISVCAKPVLLLGMAIVASGLPVPWMRSLSLPYAIAIAFAILALEVLLTKLLFKEAYSEVSALLLKKFGRATKDHVIP